MWWPWWVAIVCFVVAVLSFAAFHASALANWLTIAGIVFGVIGMLRDRLERERLGK